MSSWGRPPPRGSQVRPWSTVLSRPPEVAANATRSLPGRKASEWMRHCLEASATTSQVTPPSPLRKKADGRWRPGPIVGRRSTARAATGPPTPSGLRSHRSPPSTVCRIPLGVATRKVRSDTATRSTARGRTSTPASTVGSRRQGAPVAARNTPSSVPADHGRAGQREREHLPPLQAGSQPAPRPFRARGREDAAEAAVAHHPRENASVRRVVGDPRDEALREAQVRGGPGRPAVGAAQDARPVAAEEQRPVGQDEDRVDHELPIGAHPPGRAAVLARPEALGRPRVERVGPEGMEGEGAGPAAARRDAADLGPALGGVAGAVDAAAGGGVDHVGQAAVDGQGHDVGVVDDAGVDRAPVAAAVPRLPGQVPGARRRSSRDRRGRWPRSSRCEARRRPPG